MLVGLFLLRADNDREGGTLSLLALLMKTGRYMPGLFFAGLVGAALFIGDAMITPALSVISAVEGLKLVTPALDRYVLPIAAMLASVTRREDDMKHHDLDQLLTLARIGQDFPQILPRDKRLQRWVDLLEADPRRVLSTLRETEYQPARVRAALHCDNSALSVAFDHPLLRAAGLENDTYEEARRFFNSPTTSCTTSFASVISARR